MWAVGLQWGCGSSQELAPNRNVVASTVFHAEAAVHRARNTAERMVVPDREAQRDQFLAAREALDAGRPRDALEVLELLLILQPGNWMFHAVLVQTIYFGLHDAERSLEASRRCLEVDPAVLECLEVRALALLDLGRTEEALLALETYRMMNPANRRVRELHARTLVHAGRSEEAVPLLREILVDDATQLQIRLLLAHSEERVGRLREAELQFQRVAAEHRSPVDGLSHLLRFYERHDRGEDARRTQREIERRQGPAQRRRLDPL